MNVIRTTGKATSVDYASAAEVVRLCKHAGIRDGLTGDQSLTLALRILEKRMTADQARAQWQSLLESSGFETVQTEATPEPVIQENDLLTSDYAEWNKAYSPKETIR